MQRKIPKPLVPNQSVAELAVEFTLSRIHNLGLTVLPGVPPAVTDELPKATSVADIEGLFAARIDPSRLLVNPS